MTVKCHTKRANLAYLEEAVKNGYHMCIALEYDGNYYYRVRVHEADATVMFLMYLNAEVYATVQQMLGCQTILSVATGRFSIPRNVPTENADAPCAEFLLQECFTYLCSITA